jgi:hypothetical protein
MFGPISQPPHVVSLTWEIKHERNETLQFQFLSSKGAPYFSCPEFSSCFASMNYWAAECREK